MSEVFVLVSLPEGSCEMPVLALKEYGKEAFPLWI